MTFGMDLLSDIDSYIDHSILKPFINNKKIEEECLKVRNYKFASVCVNPYHVKVCYEILKDTDINVCSVVGFPLGLNKTKTKIEEAILAVEEGAKELDIVWNISAFKSREYQFVENEINEIIKNTERITHKIIVETAYLTEEEKLTAIKIVTNTKAEFIKTSTGFAPEGAKLDDVKKWKALNYNIKIKASGGIKDLNTTIEFIKAGADRIGTSSSFQILKEMGKYVR